MVAKILDGKACAAAVEESLKERISKCQVAGITPHIAVIIVGDDPASHVYVGAKIRACDRLGIKSTHIEMPESSKETELIEVIKELNNDNSVHGILIQSPLPNHMNEELLTDLIDPLKDVDGFHPVNLGRLVQSRDDCLIPCTPNGVMRLLDWAGVDTKGKQALVIGRSRNVGMPQAILLASRGADATVTIAHSRTADIAKQCLDADLIVAAVGRPNMVKQSWIKPGAIVVDVGINRVDDADADRGYILVGDVEKSASKVASWITPVPGGVGPMTVAMLMENTVRSAEFRF
ncbi:MAG TPA: bifunctional methylenetetrahydrofolate dehydrogenase/methenyltetrahydrofolate cyclohydrolase FolD [Candidatus Poseidoniales archaeon]|nr:MAG TPA: bifunctional methylenetetrahydrofolate dehydrogenase/methenyltetrahydrofolate cyclohydrolase FolD [Candidatus Poseidoniales archaeon]HII57429.1 bifunctional methylenetetrahydrofolate dehydrogenase/methenyltetrahydrofolate cyclohydrolase FolD [Candidatus Poseidoniaceae archaeon]